MITDSGVDVRSPGIGSVVFYHKTANESYPVIIKSGRYIGDYNRISNFWYWQRVDPVTGEIGSVKEHGYGNFTKAEGWEVLRTVVVK